MSRPPHREPRPARNRGPGLGAPALRKRLANPLDVLNGPSPRDAGEILSHALVQRVIITATGH